MYTPPRSDRRQRGISLPEALVAVLVLAVGLLGVGALQSTLRGSADVARQRTEALRLAQETIESWRALGSLQAAAGRRAYADLAGTATQTIAGTNTDFERTLTVTPMDSRSGIADRDAVPRAKSLRLDLRWLDRQGRPQAVMLASAIAGTMPELAATLAVPADGDPVRLPFARHRGIPTGAKWLDAQFSAFKPPGAPADVAWRFENDRRAEGTEADALITLCTTTAADTAAITPANLSCGGSQALLVAGHVRYDTGAAAPTLAEPGAVPPPAAAGLEVAVDLAPPAAGRQSCHVQHAAAPARHTVFHCAVPVVKPPPPLAAAWSGRLVFGPAALFPDGGGEFRVCRHVAAAAVHVDASAPRTHQNFAVVRAIHDCPQPATAAHQSAPAL